jgi:decaprenylphospho-beta-D-ribofuranose 2-oxidase
MKPPTIGFTTKPLSGWGRYPVESCHIFRPEKRSEIATTLASGLQRSYISRGLGRSYGDAALNDHAGVIWHILLNRFLSFDSSSGVLECEGGVGLAEIIQYFLPRGWFLPVTPGTKFVTVGGAIAADVHGKNHHKDGSFSNFVRDFRLLIPGGEILQCSPGDNAEVFWATMGGMGLTGIVLSARLQLRRVESAYVWVDFQKAQNLREALATMEESDECYQYSVAWIDGLARGEALGRSILMRGNHAAAADLPKPVRNPLAAHVGFQWNLLFDFPSATLPITGCTVISPGSS